MIASGQSWDRGPSGCAEPATALDPQEQSTAVIHARPPATSRPRTWVLTNAPSPYQAELLSSVHQLATIDLHVRFMRVPPNSLLASADGSGMVYRELWGAAPQSWRDEFRLHPRAVWEAAFGRFDCFILSGLYTSSTFLVCAALLTLRRKPWAVWLERPRVDRYQVPWGRGPLRGGVVQSVKRFALRFLLRHATRVIGMGSAAVRAYRDLGAAENKLRMLPYCCDVERFSRATIDDVAHVRRRYQLEGKTVFLFSGQMIERKGVDVVVAAFERLTQRHENVALLLLGDGPRMTEYEKGIPEHLRPQVHFTGLLSQDELPAHFAAANVFVFPSRHDGWGVVVNEACGTGLPVIASRQTGAALDLVEEGGNGFLLDCEDVQGFVAKMEFFVEHPEAAREFGRRSRELAQKFSTREGARRFRDCVLETIGDPHAEPTDP
jgi:glycosyltransferase involved in cell wall biosynthesis